MYCNSVSNLNIQDNPSDIYQGIQSGGSIHVINLLTSGMFTVNAMWSYEKY